MSFWKQLPPNPGPHFKNLGPSPGSAPIALETWSMSAPDASQTAESALTDEMRCARKALAMSLATSADHTFAVMMRSLGTQCLYTEASASIASKPPGVCKPPIKTLSGIVRSSMAVPSARNSGLESTWKETPGGPQAARTQDMASAVCTGTVLFSTMILVLPFSSPSDAEQALAMDRAAPSQYVRSAARPLPKPYSLVGVLTDTKMISACRTASSISVVKKSRLPRTASTTSLRPGS
mmetsp:Transcript_39027/g.76294  ORF Transcript_39027/g.76294 Transcript_39027/m.76294 type:complete len:237 (-) Transcript_39027:322-1032(-)